LKRRLNNAGFTLIEVLLSIAIITLITGMGIPVYRTFQIRNDLDIATNTFTQSIRRAQILAQNMENDSQWGVYIEAGSIILFQGSSYATRDADYDEAFTTPDNMIITGNSEYIFEKLTGEPNTTGDTTLTSIDLETRTVTLNEKGTANY